MTDDHIIICPSDPDGETRANEFWRKEDGTIDPCDFWEVSYTYYGWAVRPEFVIDPATDVNADPPTAHSSSKCTPGDFSFLQEDFIGCSVSEAFFWSVV